jgi:hypothetical protein
MGALSMGFLKPSAPEFDTAAWPALPYPERLRLMCHTWAMQGFGAPLIAYGFYVVKLVLFVGGFVVFARFTDGVDSLGGIGAWWARPQVFAKAVLWCLVYEAMGLGCGSGPLTGRYSPPVTAGRAFLRVGGVRLPPWPRLPLTGGSRRNALDVALYGALLALTLRALLAGDPLASRWIVSPIIVVMVLAGLRDRTVFLAGRSEHYLLAAFVLLFPSQLFAGEQAVQAGLWFWAATSKLNHHFPNVIAVMLSNNPFFRSRRLRRWLYRDFPDDLRGSRWAAWVAHGATVLEYAAPLVLVFAPSGPVRVAALVAIVAFHTIILTSFPLGVPLEWNLFFIYSALVLFGAHGDVRIWHLSNPVLITVLVICLVAIPAYGNVRPDRVSFLPAMRYYAGNWAIGTWLMRPGCLDRIEDTLRCAAATPAHQLEGLGDDTDVPQALGRGQAFRAMHLHGRALAALVPLGASGMLDDSAYPDPTAQLAPDELEVLDGEMVAGMVLGWNFGDGHLHDERFLEILQEACGFAPGDVRAVMIEGQALGSPTMAWRIVDAASGTVASGNLVAADLLDHQPWEANGLALHAEA